MAKADPDWPGLWVRVGDRIERAPAEDEAVARGYPDWHDKGALGEGGRRLTILAAARRYRVGEEIHVIHVYEITAPGLTLYPVGPKSVLGLRVDHVPVGAQDSTEDPLAPASYEGITQPSPGIDYNWDISKVSFDRPGRHLIEWQIGTLRSNTLTVDIDEKSKP